MIAWAARAGSPGWLPSYSRCHRGRLADRVGIGRVALSDVRRGAREIRAEATRLDDGHVDAERRHLGRKHLGEALDAELRRRIRRSPYRAGAAADRGDLDEPAAALLAKQRDGCLGHDDGAEEVGLDLRSEGIDRRVLDRRHVAVSGVVDDDVQAAEPIQGGRHGTGGRRLIRDIERQSDHTVAPK